MRTNSHYVLFSFSFSDQACGIFFIIYYVCSWIGVYCWVTLTVIQNKNGSGSATITNNKVRLSAVCLSAPTRLTVKYAFAFFPLNPKQYRFFGWDYFRQDYCKACWSLTPPWVGIWLNTVSHWSSPLVWSDRTCIHFLSYLRLLKEFGLETSEDISGWCDWGYPTKYGILSPPWGVYRRLRVARPHRRKCVALSGSIAYFREHQVDRAGA